MRSRFKYLLLILALVMALVGCGQDPKKEGDLSGEAVENIEDNGERKKLVINHFYISEDDERPDPNEYSHYYTDGKNSGEYLVLTAEMDLVDLEIVELEYKDDLTEKAVLESFDIKEGERLLVNAVFPEGIPILKLKWTYAGQEDEYVLQFYQQEDKEYVEYLY